MAGAQVQQVTSITINLNGNLDKQSYSFETLVCQSLSFVSTIHHYTWKVEDVDTVDTVILNE